jgi:N-methylhydantoinase A
VSPVDTEDNTATGGATMRLGVDVGGTFTDFIVVDDRGEVHCYKVPSTPRQPANSTIAGVAEIVQEMGVSQAQLDTMQHTHSSTIATNAVIERRGPALGVLVTQGFRDLLEIQRLAVPDPLRYDSTRPQPFAPRALVAEVRERIGADGSVVIPLDEAQLLEAAGELVAKGCEGIAICFLHSYANVAHEARAAEVINGAYPELPVEVSGRVWPQAREYERATLTIVNAAIRPVMQRYLDEVVRGMLAEGLGTEPRVARSNGGMQRSQTIREWPVAALLSGPAAGVAGAARAGRDAGWPQADLITVDVGGTSADIGIVRGGAPVLSSDEHIAGMPVLIPTIAVSSIGAGGGSVIWADSLGSLKVGPQSLGADPGPACYGQQSEIPGLSDAFLVAGWLSPDQQLAGRLRLSEERALASLQKVADRTGGSATDVADGAIRIATALMAAEATSVLSRYGVDAPSFRLVAYGGAGPLIGALLADEIYVSCVLIPPTPGALSAFGAATSDVEGDMVAPVYRRMSLLSPELLPQAWARLHEQIATWVDQERSGLQVEEIRTTWSVEMRYEGQGYDLNVQLEEEWLKSDDREAMAAAFHRVHQEVHGHSSPQSDIWLQELRAHVVGVVRKPETRFDLGRDARGRAGLGPRRRTIRLDGSTVEAVVYDRWALPPDTEFEGPAIIEQMDTTVLVPTNWRARAMPSGSLVLESTR